MKDMHSEPMLEVSNVVHKYGRVTALSDVSLSAAKGEFLTILGSSGSGKTTMLRVISGLETPHSVDRLRIGGEDVVGLPAAKRNCTTVFQNYALFPHMNVIENVAYGLRIRGRTAQDSTAEAKRALEMVQLGAKADRSIVQLSGGERQRVALARAVVTRPAILLLDEPLGALDERLRQDMQLELIELQRKLCMTFIYITHSQEEALTMSDRVVLMKHGRIEQSGAPLDLFDRPVTRFAADFMGYENILDGKLLRKDGEIGEVELVGGAVVRGTLATADIQPGSAINLAIRAERIGPVAGDEEGLDAILSNRVYRGKYTDMMVETKAGTLRLRSWHGAPNEKGAISRVGWKLSDAVIFPEHKA
ncbi:ABC transporter ATP-binding protein [Rhodobacteraceae bacterium KMM 6894]|nr:ABC transporter ATP-binding protein [Rhodobacteraceae bacterium KMM 6894]